MADDNSSLPLLPDQRPPKFPASLGACLTRNGEHTHLKILQKQFGDWTSRHLPAIKHHQTNRKVQEGTKRRRDGRRLSLSFQETCLKRLLSESSEPTPYMIFKRTARTVRIITSVCLALKSYVKKKDSHDWSFIEMYLHVKKDMKDSLVFNPYNFIQEDPPPRGNARLQRVLTTLPSLRTPADILLILTFLRNNRSFKDYPPYTQIELCKCMILQNYESRRIVVKQGQRASAFYIIKSGTLLINVTETNERTGKKFYRSCAELKEGSCFGEVGLLERCSRTASVVCKTDCQLLLVLQEDFDRLIREPLLQQRQEHVEYCQRLALFQHFPCDKLSINQTEFFYQYFPKETIITTEASKFKYLIVVMTGKCRLISCLDESRKEENEESERTEQFISNRSLYPATATGFRKRSDVDIVILDRKSSLLRRGKTSLGLTNPSIKESKATEPRPPSFAQLAEFTPGSVFGLESFVHGERKGLKIISDGVECLFLLKRLFIQEANIKVLSVVNDMVMTLPSQEDIMNKVEEQRTWLHYKQRMIQKSLEKSVFTARKRTAARLTVF